MAQGQRRDDEEFAAVEDEPEAAVELSAGQELGAPLLPWRDSRRLYPGRDRSPRPCRARHGRRRSRRARTEACHKDRRPKVPPRDRKSTRLNSSHHSNSYAVFCLKKKNT